MAVDKTGASIGCSARRSGNTSRRAAWTRVRRLRSGSAPRFFRPVRIMTGDFLDAAPRAAGATNHRDRCSVRIQSVWPCPGPRPMCANGRGLLESHSGRATQGRTARVTGDCSSRGPRRLMGGRPKDLRWPSAAGSWRPSDALRSAFGGANAAKLKCSRLLGSPASSSTAPLIPCF